MPSTKAEIISIGNEILSGQTVNTNATWISRQLRSIGLQVGWVTTIPDTAGEIERAIQTAGKRADAVFCTGGLGPTPDDITKNSICRVFEDELVIHEETLERVKKVFEGRDLEMPAINEGQALVPRKATVIANDIGTAPGIQMEKDGRLFFFMPGVPREMKGMISNSILTVLQAKFELPKIHSRLFRTTGIAESRLFERLEPVLEKNTEVEVAFLPRFVGVDIRLKSTGNDTSFNSLSAAIRDEVAKYIFTEAEEELPETLGRLLHNEGLSLAVAESFTGGQVADEITNIPGSSRYFLGSITTYSNESKMKQLGVSMATLKNFGAVSEKTVVEMANGVQKLFGSRCAIATTGIAGPDGASESKPLGLCYLAAKKDDQHFVKRFVFGKDRLVNKQRGTMAAMELLRRLLLHIE